ncbi:MAG: FAD-dependent oxidoreductase [Candidatus Rokuibacteriota bacterium]
MAKVAAVLGAGIQGCCAALALRQLGFRVRLYDKSRALMNRASANQEGKIHLGFVYARDESMVTARTMIEHALRFAPGLESLIGTTIDWEPHLSERFYCGIHRDSSLTMDEHVVHFNTLEGIYQEASDDQSLHYLGRRPKRIWSMDAPFRFSGSSLIHAVRSEETAVHPGWMRHVMVTAVEQDPEIATFVRHDVEQVEKAGGTFTIFGKNMDGAWKTTADIVVNCLWEGKHRIDGALRRDRSSDWITRVKYGFMLDSTPELRDLPSLIITHGPFGDIVNYPHDNAVYITWYPACLAYIGETDRLPEAWEAACEGHHPPGLARRILDDSVAHLAEYVPQLRDLKLRQIMAGSIMGNGKTDISDRESGLHRRHGIGVDASDGYYSIFTGKYTSGPANALELRTMLA